MTLNMNIKALNLFRTSAHRTNYISTAKYTFSDELQINGSILNGTQIKSNHILQAYKSLQYENYIIMIWKIKISNYMDNLSKTLFYP